METKFANFMASLDESIQQGQDIHFILNTFYDETENHLDLITQKILNHYKREDLIATVYTCLKELVVNGTKANAKRIFFTEQNLDLHNDADYEKGINLFRDLVHKGELDKYIKMAKNNGLNVEVVFIHNSEHLFVRVINNVELTETEKNRIIEKMERARSYDDIAQFYLDTTDAAEEGAGMGLTMIILMLKGQDLSLDKFQIISHNDQKTVATLDFPF